MKKCSMILPKLWLQAVPKYWYSKIPDNYPTTSSEFSLKFKEEVEAVVKDMEEKLNTEESIITEEMVPNGRRIGSYLGTYNVTGKTNELVLLSPNEVTSKDVSVIALHYNESEKTWEQIEDAKIVDGFVYGTVSSFSPIAVFTLRRSYYVLTAEESPWKKDTFVANGNPIIVTPNEENKDTVLINHMGDTVEFPITGVIIGGALGESIESSSVYVDSITIDTLIAGSVVCEEDEPITIETVNVQVINSVITNQMFGTGRKCRAEKVNLKLKNTKCYALGNGRSNMNSKDSNTEDNLNLSAHQWVKDSTIELENCEIEVLYSSGISGMSYSVNSNIIINGGKFNYIAAGGSNGRTEKATIKVTNAEIKNLITTNRGSVGEAKMIVHHCNVDELYIGGSNDSDITGTVEKVSYDIKGGTINMYVGTNSAKPITYKEASEIISAIKISRSTNVEYKENANYILAEFIAIR